MNRLVAMVPPPLEADIEQFQVEKGYENKSQAARELLRRGLYDAEQRCKQ